MSDVTIILTTYNRLEMLKRSLASILSQEGVSFEILLLDNGSSDGTEEWTKTLPTSIEVRRQEINRITYKTLYDPEEIKSPYTVLFADDDIMLPDCLAKKVAVLEADPTLGLVYSRCRHMTSDGKDLGIYNMGLNVGNDILSGAATFKTLFIGDYIAMPSVMLRTEAFKQIAELGFDKRFIPSGDWMFWLDLLYRGWDAAYLFEPTVSIGIHPAQDSVIQGRSGGFSRAQLAIWSYWINERGHTPATEHWHPMFCNLYNYSPKELLAANLDQFEALKPKPEFHPI